MTADLDLSSGVIPSEMLKVRFGRFIDMGSVLRVLVVLFCAFLLVGCLARQPAGPAVTANSPLLSPLSAAGQQDGRGRFREIYCAIQKDHGAALPCDRPCDQVLMRLEGEEKGTGEPVWLGQARLPLRFLVVSGLFSDCVSNVTTAYSYGLRHLERLGFKVGTVPVSGRSSSRYNADRIRETIGRLDMAPTEKVVLVGYSKGVPDILEAVVNYPELQKRVIAVVSMAGAVGGSAIIDSVEGPFLRLVESIPVPTCLAGDGGGIESLKQVNRRRWLLAHRLPDSMRYFSVVGFAERERISSILRPTYDKLSLIDPRNDGQLLFRDQVIPGSTLLGYVAADHWAIAMPFSQDMPVLSATLLNRNEFPREVLLEATLRHVEETLGNSW